MMRDALLYLSTNRPMRRVVEGFPLSQRAAGRFVAGTAPEDALRAIRELNRQGLLATLDHLGEGVSDERQARQAAQAYLDILDRIHEAGLRSNVSLKLTQFGIDVSEELAHELVRVVAQRARECGNFVRIDMENHPYTDRTLALYRRLRDEGYNNVGVVIQSYLYRSADDIRGLIPLGARVRLCKGAYLEPPTVAFPEKAKVDANFVALTRLLLGPEARAAGVHAAIATHDVKMIQATQEHAAAQGIAHSAYEFQMLYGVRRDLQRQLAQQGHVVRVYVPYGREWYPYFMRRLAERPANVMFVLRNIVSERG